MATLDNGNVLKKIKKTFPKLEVIVGNIATAEAAIDLVKAGIYSFNEMGAILPMALPGAVKATITIEKFYLLKC